MRRAVVIVGPVDPPRNDRTRAYIAEADRVAHIVEGAGYRVARLYHPRATWHNVRAQARGADLLIYYGHGNGYGWMGHTSPDWINGLCLTDPRDPNAVFAGMGVPGGSANDLAHLDLAPDSTVAMIHACYAAGASALDSRPVDYETAVTRAAGYAQAFFRAGAAHYLATNYIGAAPQYFRRWAKGQPLADAFLQTVAGQRVHSGPGVFLAEDRRWPNDRSRWVSACASRPVQLASRPPADDAGLRAGPDQSLPRERSGLLRHCGLSSRSGTRPLLAAWRASRQQRDALRPLDGKALHQPWLTANASGDWTPSTQVGDPDPAP